VALGDAPLPGAALAALETEIPMLSADAPAEPESLTAPSTTVPGDSPEGVVPDGPEATGEKTWLGSVQHAAAASIGAATGVAMGAAAAVGLTSDKVRSMLLRNA
jgi:hypothetical protein